MNPKRAYELGLEVGRTQANHSLVRIAKEKIVENATLKEENEKLRRNWMRTRKKLRKLGGK